MMENVFLGFIIFLGVMMFICLYRAYAGPTAADRIVAIDVISTKIAVLIAFLAIQTGQDSFIDVALVYAMIGFIATISVSKYIEKGKLY